MLDGGPDGGAAEMIELRTQLDRIASTPAVADRAARDTDRVSEG
jgi:hypothetical protein